MHSSFSTRVPIYISLKYCTSALGDIYTSQQNIALIYYKYHSSLPGSETLKAMCVQWPNLPGFPSKSLLNYR